MSDQEIESPNFDFLAEHDPILTRYPALAERYVFDDPNTSLVKLRQFGESLAKFAAASRGFDTTDLDFREVTGILWRNQLLPREVRELFDMIRLRGNDAVHQGQGDRTSALQGLITAQRLAVWFHRTFSDPDFDPGPFRPPAQPEDVDSSLEEEIKSLRDSVASYEEDLLIAEGEVAELESIQDRLEQEAKKQKLHVELIEALLEMNEEEQQAERAAYESKLQALSEEAKENTSADVESFVERSRKAATGLGLRGQDVEHLPIANLRIRGPRNSGCCNAPTLLVQSMQGGFVTANCCVCNEKSTLKEDEFFKLDLWVNCPKCRVRMEPKKLDENYGYRCLLCEWRCLLASLVPNFSELV